MYSVVYAEYSIFIDTLNAIKLSVIMQSAVAPLKRFHSTIFAS
jgi:hypothetical protein